MAETQQIRFTVTGMTCGGCEREVKQALERLAGVKVIAVDRTKNEARVNVEGTAASVDQMVAAIQGAGRFQAKLAAG
jgi:copper chaperone CopZ